MADIIIVSVVAVILVAVIIRGIRKRKNGSCSCGCDGCGMSSICHSPKECKQDKKTDV